MSLLQHSTPSDPWIVNLYHALTWISCDFLPLAQGHMAERECSWVQLLHTQHQACKINSSEKKTPITTKDLSGVITSIGPKYCSYPQLLITSLINLRLSYQCQIIQLFTPLFC